MEDYLLFRHFCQLVMSAYARISLLLLVKCRPLEIMNFKMAKF